MAPTQRSVTPCAHWGKPNGRYLLTNRLVSLFCNRLSSSFVSNFKAHLYQHYYSHATGTRSLLVTHTVSSFEGALTIHLVEAIANPIISPWPTHPSAGGIFLPTVRRYLSWERMSRLQNPLQKLFPVIQIIQAMGQGLRPSVWRL